MRIKDRSLHRIAGNTLSSDALQALYDYSNTVGTNLVQLFRTRRFIEFDCAISAAVAFGWEPDTDDDFEQIEAAIEYLVDQPVICMPTNNGGVVAEVQRY